MKHSAGGPISLSLNLTTFNKHSLSHSHQFILRISLNNSATRENVNMYIACILPYAMILLFHDEITGIFLKILGPV